MTEKNILQVDADRSTWVFTYVRAGETVRVRDKDVGVKPLVKDHDVVQGHVVTQDGVVGPQFMPYTPAARFIAETKELDAQGTARYFAVPNDGLPAATLQAVRMWVANQQTL